MNDSNNNYDLLEIVPDLILPFEIDEEKSIIQIAPRPVINEQNRIIGNNVHFAGNPSERFIEDFKNLVKFHIQKIQGSSATNPNIFEWEDAPQIGSNIEINFIINYKYNTYDFRTLKKLEYLFSLARNNSVPLGTIVEYSVGGIGSLLGVMGTPGLRKIYADTTYAIPAPNLDKNIDPKLAQKIISIYNKYTFISLAVLNRLENERLALEKSNPKLDRANQLELTVEKRVGYGLCDSAINAKGNLR